MIRDAPQRGQKGRRERQRQESETRQEARGEEAFRKAHNAQRSYASQLRHLARQVARIIEAHTSETDPNEPIPAPTLAKIEAALQKYATAIAPWARASAARMIAEVNRRGKTAWESYTKEMGKELRRELRETDIGERVDELLYEQVRLITTLPILAGERIHEKTLEAITLSSRYPDQKAAIREALAQANPDRTEAWLKARATMIARTETARTASVLTQARAESIGAESYIWKTAGDDRVRPSHRKLNNTTQRWDKPPRSDPPDYHSHPGQIFNCRCIALPIIPV